MTDPSAARPFAEMILDGSFDDHLDMLGTALRQRRDALNAEGASQFMVDDRVVFTKGEGFVGKTGTVKKVAIKKVTVILTTDAPFRSGRRVVHPGTEWAVPGSWLVRDES